MPGGDRMSERDVKEEAAVWLAPSELRPWTDNPRKNDGEPVERVAESIKRFGFGAPIVARRDTREIIAGHTRWKAARQLGLRRVPVRLMDLDEHEAHVLAVADNRIPELTEWSEGLDDVLSSFDDGERELAGFPEKEGGGEASVTSIDVSEVSARFFLQAEGPIESQPEALELLREALDKLGVTLTVMLV